MKKEGFSLIELLVVIIILGIVASLGTVSFTGWVRKHDLESQVKEMYTDLINARITAMHQNRAHFITLVDTDLDGFADKITASEDTDGDGAGDSPLCIWNRNRGDPVDAGCPSDKSLSYKKLTFPLTWNGSTTTLEFNPRGLYNTPIPKTICVFSTYNPSYDCIIVSQTRISMGKLKNQIDGCNSGITGNCQPKK
jgi:prepilin-type N-terminal cleavage/methylation domain-containing protein